MYCIQNAVFIPENHIKAIQGDITSKTVPMLLHHTVEQYLPCPTLHEILKKS